MKIEEAKAFIMKGLANPLDSIGFALPFSIVVSCIFDALYLFPNPKPNGPVVMIIIPIITTCVCLSLVPIIFQRKHFKLLFNPFYTIRVSFTTAIQLSSDFTLNMNLSLPRGKYLLILPDHRILAATRFKYDFVNFSCTVLGGSGITLPSGNYVIAIIPWV